METLGFSELKVSDAGLREGVLLDLMDRVVGPAPSPIGTAPVETEPGLAERRDAVAETGGAADTDVGTVEALAGSEPRPAPGSSAPFGGDSGEPLPE